jgi:hypothetical protein
MYEELEPLLSALSGIRQNPRYHPEGDALFHSLQAFELARAATGDRALWGAALLHDVGKALGSAGHAVTGADLLDGIVSPRIVWLVRHHLDLLDSPAATKQRLHGTAALRDLVLLRTWDVRGRRPDARVLGLEDALAVLLEGGQALLSAEEGELSPIHEHEEDAS